jgi:hypothetical protein
VVLTRSVCAAADAAERQCAASFSATPAIRLHPANRRSRAHSRAAPIMHTANRNMSTCSKCCSYSCATWHSNAVTSLVPAQCDVTVWQAQFEKQGEMLSRPQVAKPYPAGLLLAAAAGCAIQLARALLSQRKRFTGRRQPGARPPWASWVDLTPERIDATGQALLPIFGAYFLTRLAAVTADVLQASGSCIQGCVSI